MSRLHGQQGQTAAEYMGLLLVVATVIAAIHASGIAEILTSAIARQISCVASDVPCEEPGARDEAAGDRRGEAVPDRDAPSATPAGPDPARRRAARARERDRDQAQTRLA